MVADEEEGFAFDGLRRADETFNRNVSIFSQVSRLSDPLELACKDVLSRQCTEIDSLVSQAVCDAAIGRVLDEAVRDCKFCVSIGDPRLPDCPLIAISDQFEAMTGYPREDLIGRNCRILSRDCFLGVEDSMDLRQTCRTGQPFTGIVLNRKKSGELFQNLVDLRGLNVARNPHSGEYLWFVIGIQADVTHMGEEDVPEHHFSSLQETVEMIRDRISGQLSALAVSGAYAAESEWMEAENVPKMWWMLPRPTLVSGQSLDSQAPLSIQESLESPQTMSRNTTDELELAAAVRQISTVPQLAECVGGGRMSLSAAALLDHAVIADAIGQVLQECKFCVSIGDPRLEDCPLIAVSDRFENMTGYSREEILGNNCRILNKNCMLNPADLAALREACDTGAPFTKVLLNRRKSGELFLNLLDLRGLTIAYNPRTGERLWFLIGIQADITHMASEDIPQNHLEHLRAVASNIRLALSDRVSSMAVAGTLEQPADAKTSSNRDIWCPLEEVQWKAGFQLGGESRQVSLARSCSSTSDGLRSRQQSSRCHSRQMTAGRQKSAAPARQPDEAEEAFTARLQQQLELAAVRQSEGTENDVSVIAEKLQKDPHLADGEEQNSSSSQGPDGVHAVSTRGDTMAAGAASCERLTSAGPDLQLQPRDKGKFFQRYFSHSSSWLFYSVPMIAVASTLVVSFRLRQRATVA
eukprot:TRINITY_DN8823_c0_g1_i1.p1 TRINITY_DN8823_c0_g1~~TRINITY_DN8823_c0_g1_i1.p1  ORF type:complete len:696 (+),score=121.88 TRINITY_DN8823_c0_g1_i1:371-2458(+)